MNKGYLRQMRRQDRRIERDECLSILKKGEYGILSLCTQQNGGYGIPLNFVFMNGSIFFHCASEGRKIEEMKRNNKVSFCVVGKTEIIPEKFTTEYESVIVFGKTFEIAGEEKRKALECIVKKYSADFWQEGRTMIDNLFDKT
ncbi:MAG: pyridoxamine 5'-phosphate oxidase family protein, partial [Candidatus Cloacimonetes bacterium]|nr:pyridoxamine 5'-phosphate oxidase family protein [Candidatus Cloacimonadota bacterium]